MHKANQRNQNPYLPNEKKTTVLSIITCLFDVRT